MLCRLAPYTRPPPETKHLKNFFLKKNPQYQNARYIQRHWGISIAIAVSPLAKEEIHKNHQDTISGVCQPVLSRGPKRFPAP